MAYLYRHIRLDKNEPFYIGIGSDNKYKRAHNKKGRSYSWKDIAYNVSYEIEILLDNLSWEDACNKRIKIYCPELNIIFNSLTETSKSLNKSTGNISNIISSKTNKSRNGLTLIKYE